MRASFLFQNASSASRPRAGASLIARQPGTPCATLIGTLDSGNPDIQNSQLVWAAFQIVRSCSLISNKRPQNVLLYLAGKCR